MFFQKGLFYDFPGHSIMLLSVSSWAVLALTIGGAIYLGFISQLVLLSSEKLRVSYFYFMVFETNAK